MTLLVAIVGQGSMGAGLARADFVGYGMPAALPQI